MLKGLTIKSTRSRRGAIIFIITGFLSLLFYHVILRGYFPADGQGLGHDYSYFLPRLLDGYYWYRANGAFETPWFTPSFCGGLPFFANPQSMYYSAPQVLTWLLGPVDGVYYTILVFAFSGFTGFYLLLRASFAASRPTAYYGALLFMFNGFYLTRMQIGHLSFHGFMLVPLVCHFILRPETGGGKRYLSRFMVDECVAGLGFAYMVHSGMAAIGIPVVIAVMAVILTHGIAPGGSLSGSLLRLGAAGVIGALASSSKLVAMVALLAQYPHNYYSIPGTESIAGLLVILTQSLFFQISPEMANNAITNSSWYLPWHEFDYSITAGPFFILLIGGYTYLRSAFLSGAWRNMATRTAVQALATALLLAIPLVSTFHSQTIVDTLSAIPFARSTSNFFRWFIVYIPSLILFTVIVMERTPQIERRKTLVATLGIIIIIVSAIYFDREDYHGRPYPGGVVVKSYFDTKDGIYIPRIDRIGAYVDANGKISSYYFKGTDNLLAKGVSQMICYEPVFGNSMERFPAKALRLGPVMDKRDGYLNLKNPSCYLYPLENGCLPGDNFKVNQTEQAELFASYKPFSFAVSWPQKAANGLSTLVLALVGLNLVAQLPRCIRGACAPPVS